MSIILGPTAQRLSPVITVTEQNGYWLKGRAVIDAEICVELSFEAHNVRHMCFAGTPFTYIGIFRGKRNLYEFQLGKSAKPRGDLHTDEDAVIILSNLRGLMIGHNPVPVVDRHVSETKRAIYRAHKSIGVAR